MSALTEFLLARFADDEHRLELPEFFEEDSARGPGWGNRGECPICGAHQFSGTEPVTEEAWCEHAEKVHQRTRVLAECDAKRRIVELMVNEVKDARRRPGWTLPDSEMDEKGRDYRAGFENARAQQLPDVLDRTDRVLRLLALPYADHPSYDEAWRP